MVLRSDGVKYQRARAMSTSLPAGISSHTFKQELIDLHSYQFKSWRYSVIDIAINADGAHHEIEYVR